MTGKNFLLMCLGIVVVIPVARYVGRAAGEAQNNRDATSQAVANSAGSPAVLATVTRQDAEGVTEADFSPEFLQNLGDWVEQRTAANAKKHWDAAGVPEDQRSLSNESVFVEAGPHKLAVVRLRIGETTPNAIIAGVVGTEMVRVMCFNSDGADVQITSGPCDDKIREAFGASMNPLRN